MNTAKLTSRFSRPGLGGWLVVLVSTATVILSTCVLPSDINPAIELSLSADSVRVGLGATATAPVEVLSGGTAYSGVQVSLQSDDTSIVAVGSGGALTGVRRGTAAIEVQLVSSASGGGTLPSAQFTAKVVAASLDVTPQTTDTITALGDSIRFVPVVRDVDNAAVDDTVSCLWQVSDSSVVSVSAAGWVMARKAGQATVTATAPWDGKSGSHAITVVQEVHTVEVYPARIDTLTAIGDTASFVARARDRNDSTVAAATFTWSSGNATVATVTAVDAVTALATAQGRGSVEVTARAARLPQAADSVSGRDTVVVWQVPQQALLTGPDSQPGDVVDGPFRLTSADANGHPTPVNVATVFDLSTTSPDGAFCLDAAGSTPASMVTIAAGDSTVAFYYRDIRPGPQTIAATWSSGDDIGSATHSVTIVTVAVSVTATPAGASVSGVGATLQLTAEARDGHGFVIPNPAVTWVSLNANVATINAGGLVTAVASGQVTVRAEVDAVEAYAVVTVAAPAATAINLWAPTTSGTSESLRAVWGISPSDAFAVGTNGAVLRFTGSSWSAVASGSTQGLNGVWGTSSSDIYVVGTSGTILHYDGTGFRPGTSGTTEHLLGVWGASPGNVYAVGEAGTILHYNGSSWSAATSGTTASLYGVWGTATNDVFAVGSGGTVLHWDGSSWTSQTSGTTEDLYAVWGTSASNVYAVGALGTILRYGGTSWSAEASGTTEDLRAVWGTSSNAVFAVGAAGVLARYGGTSWSQVSSGVTQGLLGVWGISSGSGFAVGSAGTILRGYRGATVSVTPNTNTLTFVNETAQLSAAARDASGSPISGVTFTWSSSNESVATVSAAGLVTAVANGTATITATAPGGAVGTATITVAQEVETVAVSPAGAIVSGVGATQQFSVEARDAGGSVIPAPSLSVTWTSLNPYVATVNPTSGLATAAAAGQVTIEADVDGIMRYALLTVVDPAITPVTVWSPISTGLSTGLGAVWAASPSDVFAATGSSFVHYDGTTWTSQPTSLTHFLNDVWGTSPGDVYAVGWLAYGPQGAQGTILHYDGASWTSMQSGTSSALLGVWGSSPKDIFAVGEDGAILHYDGTSWTPMSSGTTNDLLGVYGFSPSEVYAVGGVGMEESTVLRYDGTSWSLMWSSTGPTLQDVWGSSGVDIFAPDDGWSNVLHYDGTSWSYQLGGNGTRTNAVWGTSSKEVYVVSSLSQTGDAAIFHYDGTSWHRIDYPIPMDLTDVSGAPSGDVFAVGNTDTVLRGHRGATVTVTPDNTRLNAISETIQLTAQAKDRGGNLIADVQITWSVDNEAVVTVDQTGLVTATGTGSARVTVRALGGAADTATVRVIPVADSVEVSPIGASVSGVGSTQLFTVQAWDAGGLPIASPAVTWTSLNPDVATIHSTTGLATAVSSGQVAVAAEVDGIVEYGLLTVAVPGATPVTIWSTMVSGTGTGLDRVWGSAATDVYAVGGGRQTLHYDGVTWDTLSSSLPYFQDVWGTSATDIFAVSGGSIHHYDGTTWSAMVGGTASAIRAVWGASPIDVYAVGDDGLILHYDGTTWSIMASGTTGGLMSVWGTSATDVYAVGGFNDDGILHYDGTGWSLMAGTTGYSPWGVWGSSATDIYAVCNGSILHYDGISWSPMSGIGGISVWGTSPTDAYAVGWGTIFRYNGTSWSTMASEGTLFHDVWGTSAGDVYVVNGSDGAILRGVRGATVVVTPGEHTLTAIGDTVRLTAEARDAANNAFGGVTFQWSSSVQSVATVDATGLVTAVGSGATTITATATGPGGVTGTATVRVIPQFSTISDGARGSCGITPGHALYCWGDNSEGQLANGTYTLSTVPVRVADSLRFSSVDAMGNLHRCAVTVNGTAYCWGTDVNGQLGDGAATHPDCPGGYACSNVLVKVTGDLEFTTVSAGDLGHHTCGLVGDAAYCWGSSDHGQLGTVDGSGIPGTFWSPEPLLVPGGLTFIRITAGMYHTCGLTTEGTAFCWGRGDEGQLGHAARTSSAAPVMIAGAVRFTEITAGSQHTCGLTVSGDAYCWGLNDYGQLGSDGVAVGASADTAVLVSAQLAFTSLDAGHRHTCGIAAGGAAYCWGWGVNGALGNGSVADQNTPIPVAGGHVFVSLVGGGHSCGVTTGGDAYCWGQNVYGQLGNGVTESRTVPDRVLFPPP